MNIPCRGPENQPWRRPEPTPDHHHAPVSARQSLLRVRWFKFESLRLARREVMLGFITIQPVKQFPARIGEPEEGLPLVRDKMMTIPARLKPEGFFGKQEVSDTEQTPSTAMSCYFLISMDNEYGQSSCDLPLPVFGCRLISNSSAPPPIMSSCAR